MRSNNDVNKSFFLDSRVKLYRVYINASKNVPYYQKSLNKDIDINDFNYELFKSIPILNKNEIIKNSDSFISDKVKKENLFVESTSGTEGQPLLCYKSHMTKSIYAYLLWNSRKQHIPDLSNKDKFARFYSIRQKGEDLIMDKVLFKGNDIHIPLNNMSSEKIEYYWSEIASFKPRWMHGPVTAIIHIARYLQKNNIKNNFLELIELNGEKVTSDQKVYIEDVFKCKVINHYGSREFWGLAFSNNQGDLSILKNSCFVESIYNEELKNNELIVTSLINNDWPILRYKLGDLGNVSKQGENFILTLEESRVADYFSLDGETINAIVFSGINRGISKYYGHSVIHQYQAIKLSENELCIKIIKSLDTNVSNSDIINKYKKELKNVISDNIEIIFEFVDFIKPNPKTGKVKDFIDSTK